MEAPDPKLILETALLSVGRVLSLQDMRALLGDQVGAETIRVVK